jgi:hypothetical protein
MNFEIKVVRAAIARFEEYVESLPVDLPESYSSESDIYASQFEGWWWEENIARITGAGPGRPLDVSRFLFVESLTSAYEELTGNFPPSSLQVMEGPWANFVEVTCTDVGISKPSVRTLNGYVRRARQRRKRLDDGRHRVSSAKRERVERAANDDPVPF